MDAAACAPSPTKKAYHAPTPAPAPEELRGSFARTASNHNWTEQIQANARKGRAAASGGYQGAPSTTAFPTRRPLGPARTEPVLSFAQSAVPSQVGTFQSAKDIRDGVYALKEGVRANELRPMWETGSESEAASQRSRAQTLLNGQDSGVWGLGAGSVSVNPGINDDEGDGFDLDEALGPAGGSLSFGFLGAGANEESQNSNSTARTITGGLKRAFDEEEQGDAMAEDDEMATTDVEDEAGDQPGTMLPPRRVAGSRKAFGRTQSLPSSAFSGQMQF
ncbi:hypothetical protein JCM6882_000252 [Rhodosporidiobolus microsporus]